MQRQINNKIRADFDILVDSFIDDVDIHSLSDFPLISIYKSPLDYPNQYVARIFDIQPGRVNITRYIMLCDNLETLRKAIPLEFIKLDRKADDEPDVVEVWL